MTTQPYANLTLKSDYLLVDETGLDEPRVDEMVVDEPRPKPLDYGMVYLWNRILNHFFMIWIFKVPLEVSPTIRTIM